MLFVDRLAEERREGKQEGRSEAFIDLVNDGLITEEVAASKLGITLDEFHALIKEK